MIGHELQNCRKNKQDIQLETDGGDGRARNKNNLRAQNGNYRRGNMNLGAAANSDEDTSSTREVLNFGAAVNRDRVEMTLLQKDHTTEVVEKQQCSDIACHTVPVPTSNRLEELITEGHQVNSATANAQMDVSAALAANSAGEYIAPVDSLNTLAQSVPVQSVLPQQETNGGRNKNSNVGNSS